MLGLEFSRFFKCISSIIGRQGSTSRESTSRLLLKAALEGSTSLYDRDWLARILIVALNHLSDACFRHYSIPSRVRVRVRVTVRVRVRVTVRVRVRDY